MFIGKYELDGELHFDIYFYSNYGEQGYQLWFKDTFSPNCENIEVLDFKIKGKNYKERKGCLQDIAITYSNHFASLSWSYGELATIGDYFYTNGKRYGLLKDFKENAIC